MLTNEQLGDIAQGCMPTVSQKDLSVIEENDEGFLSEYLTSPERAAGFFGNLGHESRDMNAMEENLNYRSATLKRVWPSRFRNPATVAACTMNPEALANTVYADRMGNGPSESGEGYKYRGRGPLQCTGKSNYLRCGKFLGLDLINNPDLLQDTKVGLGSAIWFFSSNKLFRYCDSMDWRTLTKRINGGYHGLDDRIRRIEDGLRAVGSSNAPERPKIIRKGARGSLVAEVQEFLGIGSDGIFGPGTEEAVKQFQRGYGLPADGIVGPNTLTIMENRGLEL